MIADSLLGALCGSELVNERFREWFEGQAPGGFAKLCDTLGLNKKAALRDASEQFEGIKQRFSGLNADPKYVILRGAQGAKRELWDKRIERYRAATTVVRGHYG